MVIDRIDGFLVIGVSGSGKTTIGSKLAMRLGWTFADADSFHPPASLEKMRAGRPLDDEDRLPWLNAIAAWIDEKRRSSSKIVIACSALKRRYRGTLIGRHPGCRLIYLQGDPATIEKQMAKRTGHFMPTSLLGSQFADLEEPGPDEQPLIIPIALPIAEKLAMILRLASLDCPDTEPTR